MLCSMRIFLNLLLSDFWVTSSVLSYAVSLLITNFNDFCFLLSSFVSFFLRKLRLLDVVRIPILIDANNVCG